MKNPYRIRLRHDGKWEVYHVDHPGRSYPRSVGSKNRAFNYMAAKLNVTPNELRQAAKRGTLEPVEAQMKGQVRG